MMDRSLYDTNIKATMINNDVVLVTADDYSGFRAKHHVTPKEWAFLQDILEAFTDIENPVSVIRRITKEYKGYD